jgi:hypothetical protein
MHPIYPIAQDTATINIYREIAYDSLDFADEVLGRGKFGTVRKALWLDTEVRTQDRQRP